MMLSELFLVYIIDSRTLMNSDEHQRIVTNIIITNINL